MENGRMDDQGKEKITKSAVSSEPSYLDENRNKQWSRRRAFITNRFSSLTRADSRAGGSADSCSPIPMRGRSLVQIRPGRQSADWGGERSVKGGGATGNRRTEVMIVLMGSSRVGKSAIVNQFLHNIFRQEYTATVDELHWIEYDATNYASQEESGDRQNSSSGILLLKVMDCSGSHEFIGMRRLYQQQGDAFILVVGADDPNSFEEAKIIRQEIAERNGKRAPVVCVLNKMDLQGRSIGAVDTDKVSDFAYSTGCIFVQATAKEHDSVAEIFKRLLHHNRVVSSAAQLKYRRKSMPISMEYDTRVNVKNALGQYNQRRLRSGKKFSKSASETHSANTDEKQSTCVIS